jgi:regulator of sirC expression with transglutaminase-like and TPR domain
MDEGVEARWAAWREERGEELPLDEAAARLAIEEGSATTVDEVRGRLDALAAGVGGGRSDAERLARLVRHLFSEVGFKGDEDDYDDPRNSRIDEVLTRRRGLPILLSVVTMEVARRVDLELHGVGFPGHFLVGTTGEPKVFLDPFAGGAIRRPSDLSASLAVQLGRTPEPAELASSLRPVSPVELLARMSSNLVQAWLRRGRVDDALRNADRRVALRPDVPEYRRDRGTLRARVGLRELAALDLGAWLAERPDAPDASRVRWQLTLLLAPQAEA